MRSEDFFYEYTRDNHGLPVCWKTSNNCTPPHFHSSLEMLYVSKGEIRGIVNGEAALLCGGEFLISPSYAVHTYQSEGSSEGYVLIIPVESVPSYKSLFSQNTFGRSFCEDHSNGEIVRCLEALQRLTDLEMDSVVSRNMIKGYLYVILSLILEETGIKELTKSRNVSLARDILIFLQEHYQENLTLEITAQHFGYSVHCFSRLFHRYFARGFSEYVNSLRCKAAIEELSRKELSLTEIAMSVGFESSRTFYRAFKRCYGMTPTQYGNRQA